MKFLSICSALFTSLFPFGQITKKGMKKSETIKIKQNQGFSAVLRKIHRDMNFGDF